MAATINKKLVSIYFEEIQYMMFQHLAKQQNCNTADVIREAMDMYLESVKNKKNDSFFFLFRFLPVPFSSPENRKIFSLQMR